MNNPANACNAAAQDATEGAVGFPSGAVQATCRLVILAELDEYLNEDSVSVRPLAEWDWITPARQCLPADLAA